MDQDNERGNAPIHTERDGGLKASIWENEGENGPFYSVKLAKTYTDRDGNLRDTSSFTGTELLQIAEVVRAAYHKTNEFRRERMRSQDQDRDGGQELDDSERAPRQARRAARNGAERSGGGARRSPVPRREAPGLSETFPGLSR
ncbi:MAG: hypothetical protein AAF830_07175 [Pseudomonadota bacterium]